MRYVAGMRYLVKARVKAGRAEPLLKAIEGGTLGQGSVAGDEYVYDMEQARVTADGMAHWVETCFCAEPLQEERPYWEEYFELVSVKDAHNRRNCRDWNGTESWACCNCDCTKRLEERLKAKGEGFLGKLKEEALPFQGERAVGRTPNPGRCPGLDNHAPSGRQTGARSGREGDFAGGV